MQQNQDIPKGDLVPSEKGMLLAFSGNMTSEFGEAAEALTADLLSQILKEGSAATVSLVIDISGLTRLDTLGAWLINKLLFSVQEKGGAVDIIHLTDAQKILLKEAEYRDYFKDSQHNTSYLLHLIRSFLEDTGKCVCGVRDDLTKGVAFFGEISASFFYAFRQKRGLRFPSVVNQIQAIAWQGIPIVSLISFVVGGIIAQQGIFQLSYFGATAFTVDLIGILTCRELAVLLTAIMVAGRSGSAFTAEIGSMKMNEEIDALQVMGMNPMNVLILPRLIALIISLPLLTFIADMASIFGGGVVCWVYGDISPDVFLTRLKPSIGLNTFLVGLIKAPFMAAVIGIIATMEGMAVQGSSESLGQRVTLSVVKSIFMVIVMDGLFAVFFAAINY